MHFFTWCSTLTRLTTILSVKLLIQRPDTFTQTINFDTTWIYHIVLRAISQVV